MTDYEQNESNQRQHHEALKQQEEMAALVLRHEYTLFSMLKPKLYVDGKQWCCLYGYDLQVGIAGFGETPYMAVMAWRNEWHKKLKK